jgi:hypothetical protein
MKIQNASLLQCLIACMHSTPARDVEFELAIRGTHHVSRVGDGLVMTPAQRLDRLERIAKLMVKAGLRARRHSREQDAKIEVLIDAQIQNEERFGRLSEAQITLAEAQAHTDQRLDALIDIIRPQKTDTGPRE